MSIRHNGNQTVLNVEREKEIYKSLTKGSLNSPQYLNLLEELSELRIYHDATVLAHIYNLPIFQEKIVPVQVAYIDEQLAVEPKVTSSHLMPELVNIAEIIIEREMKI